MENINTFEELKNKIELKGWSVVDKFWLRDENKNKPIHKEMFIRLNCPNKHFTKIKMFDWNDDFVCRDCYVNSLKNNTKILTDKKLISEAIGYIREHKAKKLLPKNYELVDFYKYTPQGGGQELNMPDGSIYGVGKIVPHRSLYIEPTTIICYRCDCEKHESSYRFVYWKDLLNEKYCGHTPNRGWFKGKN